MKNYIFDAANLSRVVYSLPCIFNALDGAGENAYALDSAHGLLATKYFVYELSRYDLLTSTLDPDASQLFFDNDGVLWFLSLTDGSAKAQIIKR